MGQKSSTETRDTCLIDSPTGLQVEINDDDDSSDDSQRDELAKVQPSPASVSIRSRHGLPPSSAPGKSPRSKQVSEISLLFTRNNKGFNFIKSSVHSSNRPYYPTPEEEYAALDQSNRSLIPFGKTVEQVYDGVHDGKVLGDGVNGEVRKVIHKETGEMFALKRLNMLNVKSEKQAMQLLDEIEIMCQLDHPNILMLEEVYESEDFIYLVEELCTGGELFDRLDEQPNYCYTEEQCAHLVLQIVSAVQYIHSQGIIHRDLKLENFLFCSPDSDSKLKMIDFGLSKHLKYGNREKDAVGTPYTVAPEVIKGSYDGKCDVWGIGVITFLLLCGDPPFGGCNGESLKYVRRNILGGKYQFKPTQVWDNVSEEAKEFIRSLLQVDPEDRPSSKKLQWSPWLKKWKEIYVEKNRNEEEDDDGNLCWFNCNLLRSYLH